MPWPKTRSRNRARSAPAAPCRFGRPKRSTGSVQGAAMVTTPASSARARLNIEQDPSERSRPRLAATSELVGSFETARRGVTRAVFALRHVFVRRCAAAQSQPAEGPGVGSTGTKATGGKAETRRKAFKSRATRKGGTPSGSLEVPGGQRTWWSVGAGLVVVGDQADLGGLLSAAVDYVLAHQHRI